MPYLPAGNISKTNLTYRAEKDQQRGRSKRPEGHLLRNVPGAPERSKSQNYTSTRYDGHKSAAFSDSEATRRSSSRLRGPHEGGPVIPNRTAFADAPHRPPGEPTTILFYHKHDPHYGFTNFSPHPVFHEGKQYPTSEHLFQSFKFQEHWPGIAEHIRTCSERPSVAFSEARRFKPQVRKDWMNVNIKMMDITLWCKFTQHGDLRGELLATGDAKLIEDSDKDSFWGVGADRRGRNELGKALERLRDQLRQPPRA